MSEHQRTVLYDRHVALGAKMVDFAGWQMPLEYSNGIIHEHLATRRAAGLFDVSHMGRFAFRGAGALPFLERLLSNDAAALGVGAAQYTMIPSERGSAIDDAYLYRFLEGEYLLVVNASNRRKDWEHFRAQRGASSSSDTEDVSDELAMISLQGPLSEEILAGIVESGSLGERRRNVASVAVIRGARVLVSRTGYTGEPICFELFVPHQAAGVVWDLLVSRGATPAGLGARDTLRLEAGLPLYGHELGADIEGNEIPIFACALAKFAVSFSAAKGAFWGRAALERQRDEVERLALGSPSPSAVLPRVVSPVAVEGRAVARAGARVVTAGGVATGYVTSGTAVPYWTGRGANPAAQIPGETGLRVIGMALVDSRLRPGAPVYVDIRGRMARSEIVRSNLKRDDSPYTRAIIHDVAKAHDSQETGDRS